MAKVSVSYIIVAFDNDMAHVAELLEALVKSGEESGFKATGILVVNDDSPVSGEAAFEVIQGHGNIGFASGVGLGVEASGDDFVVIVNPDCAVDSAAFRTFSSGLDPNQGIAVPLLADSQGRVDHRAYENWVFGPGIRIADIVCRHFIYRSRKTKIPRFVKACGAFMSMERAVALDLAKPFDEDFFLYGEDRDMTNRARGKGIPLSLRRDVVIRHLGGQSGGRGSLVVERCRADSCFRVAHRRYGRLGILLTRIDMRITRTFRRQRANTSARTDAEDWAAKRWLGRSGPADPLTILTVEQG